MAIGLYMDVHVPQAITDQLRRRGVDILTAIEDRSAELADDKLLERLAHWVGLCSRRIFALRHRRKINSVRENRLQV